MAELHEYRERFPILAETTYLINHSLGAMPAAAEERVLEYARTWNTRGVRAWEEGWWDLPLTVGDQIARLIGAPPGSVSMHQNVTIAEAVVASCFTFDGPRRRVVYEEGNFPSVRASPAATGAPQPAAASVASYPVLAPLQVFSPYAAVLSGSDRKRGPGRRYHP